MLLVLAACHPKEPTDTADTGTPGAVGTDGTIGLDFRLDTEGEGTDHLGTVTLLDAAGTLALDGVDHVGFAYVTQAWDDAGYQLYDVLSVADDGSNLALTYLYCRDAGLPYVYTESFLHPVTGENATGSCDGAQEASEAQVSLPALTGRPAAFDPGVRVSGEGASWDGTTGMVEVDGVEHEWVPFATVDCTDCAGGPWWEIHSMLYKGEDACFGILYLYPDDPTYLQLAYGICLPTLTRMEGVLAADWTGELESERRVAGSAPHGTPPPRR